VKRKPAPANPTSPPNGESTRNTHQKTLEYNDIMRKMFKGLSYLSATLSISCKFPHLRWAPLSYQPRKATAYTIRQPRNDSCFATDHHPALAERVF
jgi:hypothetical protein